MAAPDSSQGSCAWKSILQGREVLKRGAHWRVGSEEEISIWGDAWLPSIDTPRVLNSMGIKFPEIRVTSPICPSSRSWNLELIQTLSSLMKLI